MRTLILALALAAAACATPPAQPEPTSFAPTWSAEQSAAVLERTQRVRLSFDETGLSEGERAAVRELLAAGARLHQLYIAQRHPQGRAAATWIAAHPELRAESDLFWMNSGPVGTTLDNTRQPFLSASPETITRNVYPAGVTRASMDAYLAATPTRRDALLDDRAVVWAATPENRARALAALDRYPALDTLHPGLRERLETDDTYLAVPYSVAYADDLMFVYARLHAA